MKLHGSVTGECFGIQCKKLHTLGNKYSVHVNYFNTYSFDEFQMFKSFGFP